MINECAETVIKTEEERDGYKKKLAQKDSGMKELRNEIRGLKTGKPEKRESSLTGQKKVKFTGEQADITIEDEIWRLREKRNQQEDDTESETEPQRNEGHSRSRSREPRQGRQNNNNDQMEATLRDLAHAMKSAKVYVPGEIPIDGMFE